MEQHLRKTGEALQADGPSRIHLTVVGKPRSLQTNVQDELYSVAREAMTNAVRHSQAKQVLVELTYGAQQLTLRCSDNGIGVSADYVRASLKQGHWGIIGMRERARSLGCKLEFVSTPRVGTEVAIRVPARKAYAQTAARKRKGWRGRLFGAQPAPGLNVDNL